MSGARDGGEIMLILLEIAYATPLGGPAGKGVDIPAAGWTVSGVVVTTEERARAVRAADDAGYIETTVVAGYPVPTELTAAGRRFVEEWQRPA